MKFVIGKYQNKSWYIYIDNNGKWIFPQQIPEYLDLTPQEWGKIFLDNGANIFYYIGSNSIGYQFKNEEDAKEVIKVLTPYLIMKALTL